MADQPLASNTISTTKHLTNLDTLPSHTHYLPFIFFHNNIHASYNP